MTVISEHAPIISPYALSNNFNFENILDDDNGHAYIPENEEISHEKFVPQDDILDASNIENNLLNE